MELFNKKSVEIFSVGKWNDKNFTVADLNEMVRAFTETRIGIEPNLKLGHNKEQALLAKDGLPAAGWVENMYVLGDKLMADFKEIPKKIFQLLENKAYKKVSVEMYDDLKIKDKTYKHLISAVSLLGADMPAVMNLSDILALYSVDKTPKTYEQNFNETITRKEPPMKTEAEIRAEIEAETKAKADAEQVEALKTQAKEFTAKQADTDKELKELRQLKVDAEKKAVQDAIALQETETKAFIASLKADKFCTPAMEPLVAAILGENKKEYSVKIGDKDQSFSKQDLLKEALKLAFAAKEVNFTENSSEGDKNVNVNEDAQEIEVQKLIKEGMTRSKASKFVLNKSNKK